MKEFSVYYNISGTGVATVYAENEDRARDFFKEIKDTDLFLQAENKIVIDDLHEHY